MAQYAPELLAALSEKRALMEEMLLVLQEERRCIVEMDIEGLEMQVSRKSELIVAVEEAASHCAKLVREIALELKIPEAESLSPLLIKMDEPQRETLQLVQHGLLELGAEVVKMLARNADLMQGALQAVTHSLDFFGRLFNDGSTYGYAGQIVGGRLATPRILCREA